MTDDQQIAYSIALEIPTNTLAEATGDDRR
jgi:hypothetical protein